jgi:hypothetical protein
VRISGSKVIEETTGTGMTKAEAAAWAEAEVEFQAAERARLLADEHRYVCIIAVKRAEAKAADLDDPRLFRAKGALARAEEAVRLTTAAAERALVRRNQIAIDSDRRRRNSELKAGLKRSAEWQQVEQAKRDQAERETRERFETAVTRVLDGK